MLRNDITLYWLVDNSHLGCALKWYNIVLALRYLPSNVHILPVLTVSHHVHSLNTFCYMLVLFFLWTYTTLVVRTYKQSQLYFMESSNMCGYNYIITDAVNYIWIKIKATYSKYCGHIANCANFDFGRYFNELTVHPDFPLTAQVFHR